MDICKIRLIENTRTAKNLSKQVKKKAGPTRSLVNRIRKRHAAFIGHINEKGKFRTSCLHGKNGRRTRQGIQREHNLMMESLSAWTDIEKGMSVSSATKIRGVWQDMTANTMKQGRDDEEFS